MMSCNSHDYLIAALENLIKEHIDVVQSEWGHDCSTTSKPVIEAIAALKKQNWLQMTIDKFITQVVYCDHCSETFDSDEEDFFEAIRLIKKEGWGVRKDTDGSWEHICPACVEKDEELPDVG